MQRAMRQLLLRILFFVLLASFSNMLLAFPNGQSPSLSELKEKQVLVGVYPVVLSNFDYEKNSFDVIFHIWWLSRDAAYQPENITELVNATSVDQNIVSHDVKDGIYRTQTRYKARIIHRWDMTHFPFDRQTLEVKMEDGLFEREHLQYIPDLKNTDIEKNISKYFEGFRLENFSLREETQIYETNFGNPSAKESDFSRLIMSFELKREGFSEFFTYFIGFFIAVFLSSLSYFVALGNLEAKFALTLAAIFGVIGNKYIVDSTMPVSPHFSFSDAIQLASFAYIILATVVGIADASLSEKQQLARGRALNWGACLLTSVGYVGFVLYYGLLAINQ